MEEQQIQITLDELKGILRTAVEVGYINEYSSHRIIGMVKSKVKSANKNE